MDQVDEKKRNADDLVFTNHLDVAATNVPLLGHFIKFIRAWCLIPSDPPLKTLRIQFDGPINLQEIYKEDFQNHPKFSAAS